MGHNSVTDAKQYGSVFIRYAWLPNLRTSETARQFELIASHDYSSHRSWCQL